MQNSGAPFPCRFFSDTDIADVGSFPRGKNVGSSKCRYSARAHAWWWAPILHPTLLIPAIVEKKSAHQKRPRNAKEPGQNSTFVGAFGKWALKIPASVRSYGYHGIFLAQPRKCCAGRFSEGVREILPAVARCKLSVERNKITSDAWTEKRSKTIRPLAASQTRLTKTTLVVEGPLSATQLKKETITMNQPQRARKFTLHTFLQFIKYKTLIVNLLFPHSLACIFIMLKRLV